jgi:hypothetical protein
VIISSDQDYRHHFQLLRNSGYAVIVIHDAKTDRWVNVMELHATQAYRWGEIIPHTKPKPVTQKKSTSDSSPHSPLLSPIESNTDPQVVNQTNHRETSKPPTAITQPNEISQVGPGPSAAGGGSSEWLTGICTNWNKSYGFCQGALALNHPELIFSSFLLSLSELWPRGVCQERYLCPQINSSEGMPWKALEGRPSQCEGRLHPPSLS